MPLFLFFKGVKTDQVDKWRAGNEMETSRSMKRREGKERGNNLRKEKEKEGDMGRGRNKKNSLLPVFHQGRNYTFTKVFS